MLTLILCILGAIAVCFAWWHDDSKGVIGWVIVTILILFGVTFPIAYGYHMTTSEQATETTLRIIELDGTHYYFNNNKLTEVSQAAYVVENGQLNATTRKAPLSIWYWPMTKIQVTIPAASED